MKLFRLGEIAGSASATYPGRPARYWEITVSHEGSRRKFARLQRTDAGVEIPRLALYVADQYPSDMVANLAAMGHIVLIEGFPDGYGPADIREPVVDI